MVSGEVECGQGRKEDPHLPGSVKGGAWSQRSDGFTLEERQAGCTISMARQGMRTPSLYPPAPHIAATPLLSPDPQNASGLFKVGSL